jgi:hypothetical protein
LASLGNVSSLLNTTQTQLEALNSTFLSSANHTLYVEISLYATVGVVGVERAARLHWVNSKRQDAFPMDR